MTTVDSTAVDVSDKVTKEDRKELAASVQAANLLAEVPVTNDAEYEAAGKTLIELATAGKELEEKRFKITRPMDAAKTAVMDLFKAPTNAINDATAALKARMVTYVDQREAERKKAQEEADKVAAAERKKQEQAAARRVAKAEKTGDQDEIDKVAMLNNLAPPPPAAMAAPVAPAVTKPKGISTPKKWKFEVTDVRQLLVAVVAGDVPMRAIIADEKFIRKQVTALEEEFDYPGVRAYQETTISARSK